MTCEEMVEFLSRYVDGELSSQEQGVLEKHLRDCPPCEVYLDSFKETLRLGREVSCADEGGDMPESLVKAILAARAAAPSEPEEKP